MNTKFVSLLLLVGVIVGFTPKTTEAGFFDWISGLKIEADRPSAYFVGLGQNLENTENLLLNTNRIPAQLVQSTAIVAAANPAASKKTAALPAQNYVVILSAYSSTEDQTDSTPFITAAGTHVRDGVVAANFLPFGTVVRIPSVFGNKTFVVEDRMHSRFSTRMDIWFSSHEAAKEFGLKKAKVEVVL